MSETETIGDTEVLLLLYRWRIQELPRVDHGERDEREPITYVERLADPEEEPPVPPGGGDLALLRGLMLRMEEFFF